jgi:L-ascorbate metabolism protein UlaG (beta-lactamase superfamily)
MNLNDTNKVMIASISKFRYFANTSFVIITKSGTVIVVDPFKVDYKIKPDLIAVTHLHYDHYDEDFINQAKCHKIIASVGDFTFKDVKVTGVAASHWGDNINVENPDNIIYIFEVDGLRIVHFGDMGQNYLTDIQLEQIGKVDIAMMQFANPNSDFTISNHKGINILKQVNPNIVIPTHSFGLKNAQIGKHQFILPTHGVGATLRLINIIFVLSVT